MGGGGEKLGLRGSVDGEARKKEEQRTQSNERRGGARRGTELWGLGRWRAESGRSEP